MPRMREHLVRQLNVNQLYEASSTEHTVVAGCVQSKWCFEREFLLCDCQQIDMLCRAIRLASMMAWVKERRAPSRDKGQ